MAGKRFFWLKLREDFFSSLQIKKLRKLAGGDTYVVIYLKMQLRALRTDGILTWKGYEDDFVNELALDLDEEPDNVRVTLAYLLRCGLAESSDQINFFLPSVVENTGTESDSAKRVREYRERLALHSNGNVTPETEKSEERKEEESNPLPLSGATGDRVPKVKHRPDAFAAIWARYPADWRGNPQSVTKAWRKLLPDDETIDAINLALDQQLRSDWWQRGIGIPWLTTYLKAKRWLDVED